MNSSPEYAHFLPQSRFRAVVAGAKNREVHRSARYRCLWSWIFQNKRQYLSIHNQTLLNRVLTDRCAGIPVSSSSLMARDYGASSVRLSMWRTSDWPYDQTREWEKTGQIQPRYFVWAFYLVRVNDSIAVECPCTSGEDPRRWCNKFVRFLLICTYFAIKHWRCLLACWRTPEKWHYIRNHTNVNRGRCIKRGL